MIDLHMHTKNSDGSDTTEELIKKAEDMKLKYISITDHDNLYAHEAIISERNKGRKALLQKPQEYLQRIADAKQSIGLMISEERLRNNYLEGLNQLEAEFVNELAFERNS